MRKLYWFLTRTGHGFFTIIFLFYLAFVLFVLALPSGPIFKR